MKEASDALDALDQEKRALLKVMHKDYHGVDEVKDAIKHLEYEQKTTSFKSAVDENKLIKEIETLKASVPKAERFSEIRPKVKEYNDKKKKIWEQLKEQRAIAGKHEVEIEGYRKEMEAQKEAKSDIKDQADLISKDINKTSEELDALYKKKSERKEQYWHDRYDFAVQKNKIDHIEWMQRQKDRAIQHEKEKKEIIEAREQAIKELPHPY